MAVKTWASNSAITSSDLTSYVANPMLRLIYATDDLLNAKETTYNAVDGFRWYGTGLFTSEFQNYRLVLPRQASFGFPTLDSWWYLRYTVGGVANSTNNYTYALMVNTTAPAFANQNGNGVSECLVCSAWGVDGVSNQLTSFEIDIYNPQIAAMTSYAGRGSGYHRASSRYSSFSTAGGFQLNTQFDGLCLYIRTPGGATPQVATVDGGLMLYGYVQS